jgi:steroid 5-alpha reductase family enzyme
MSVALVHLGVALAISSLGFLRLVYFVSIGYAFSIAAQAGLALTTGFAQLTAPVAAHVVLLGLYGLRLGTYLVARERSASYQRELAEVQQRGAGISRLKQVGIWVSVSVLYVCMFSPALATLSTGASDLVSWVGVVLMVQGLGLEALADWQKDVFKRTRPSDYCDVGLYRYSRCPNYFGEVVFWLGNFVAGLTSYQGLGAWVAAAVGTVCITLIMMGSTKRQESKQDERYGAREDYRKWVTSVPVLVPFVPVHSLKGVRVYLE